MMALLAALTCVPGTLLSETPPTAQEIVLTPGLVITSSVRVTPGTYRLPGRDGAAAVTIRGSDITVDMTGVSIEGGDPHADPDGYAGVGIEIDGGDRVTLKGATLRGYKVAILARRSVRLHLTGNDLSYNWKQRLWSGIERESLVDWMSYHNNEKDEWLRFGAAIYLSECDEAEIDHNRAVQGQNGLMITRSSRLKIWNNTFAFLSSVGLGMYRTTDSLVAHNSLDYAVRGYSHGFYFRGQDSTGILMYEQSSRNTFHHNSATHGGDGLFLWAGQSTMDTGQGGANDNLFAGNDFSHAVANGIEATFSRNTFIHNRIEDCWHGVWGGYSFDSVFDGNTFANNDEAIAIEHGQNIRIRHNTFRGDTVALRLWANPTQDPNWGYPKTRDTRSRGYEIVGNRFDTHQTVFDLTRTSDLRVGMNSTAGTIGALLKGGVDVFSLDYDGPLEGFDGPPQVAAVPAPLPNGMNAMIADGTPRGRSTIIVDDWGPYDYKSPKVWPVGKATDRPLRLRVLGPAGAWKLVSTRGGRPDRREGTTGQEIVVTVDRGNTDLRLEFEYMGGEVVDPRGRRTPAGQPHRFVYELFEPAMEWQARWWTWDEAADPMKTPAVFAARLAQPPTLRQTVSRFDLISGRTMVEGLPNDRIALQADGTVNLPAGDYELVMITDDGIRVWVDGTLVLERWDIHGSTVDRVRLTGGRHRIRLEYFEVTGWAELKVFFKRP
jgi:nitrous oxidase accessory protein NosD